MSAFMKPGKYESSYTFEMKVHTRIVGYEKRKRETNYMVFSYGETTSSTSITKKKKEMLIISDWKNESSIMLDENKKTARVISLSFLSKLNIPESKQKEEDKDKEDFKFEKTGKTKTLSGYTCHQYIITTDKTKMELWFAPSVKYRFESTGNRLAKLMGKNTEKLPTEKGYLMEMINYEKGKKQSHLLVTKIETTPFTINISNYKIQ